MISMGSPLLTIHAMSFYINYILENLSYQVLGDKLFGQFWYLVLGTFTKFWGIQLFYYYNRVYIRPKSKFLSTFINKIMTFNKILYCTMKKVILENKNLGEIDGQI